jgi:hypothetical protein
MNAVAAMMRGPWRQVGTRCGCGHSDVTHDLNPKGVRTRCSISAGPKGTPCGCPGFLAAWQEWAREQTARLPLGQIPEETA